MEVTYVGASSVGVELVLPDGGCVFVPHGGSVDVPDEVAENLLTQGGQWEKAPTPHKAAPATVPEED